MNQQTDTGSPTLRWQAFPAGQRRGRAALALLIVASVGALVYLLLHVEGIAPWQNLIWSALAALLLFLSLHRFFFPSRYQIDNEGITYEHLWSRRRYRWDQVHRFYLDERGGFLMTTAYRPRLRPLQGVHLLFDGAREEAVRLIRQHLGRGGEP